ncbi:MAG: ParB/RepB/Spo0J family partition protein [Nitrososphaerota archaeon]
MEKAWGRCMLTIHYAIDGEKPVQIPLEKLEIDPMNVRIDVGDLSELMESIKKVGLIHPLIVRPGRNGKYRIICGSRRYHALMSLGIKEAACRVVDVNDLEAVRLSWDENEKAEKLSDSERKNVYKRVLEMTKSLRRAAEVLGVSHETIRLALADEGLDDLDDIVKVIDRRREKNVENGVGKTVKAKADRLMKKMVKKRDREGDERETPISKEVLRQQYTLYIEKLSWKPRTWLVRGWKDRYKDKPLHEILNSNEGLAAIPHPNIAKMSLEWVSAGQGPAKAMYPAVRLDPPLDRILIIVCPNCAAPLRGYGRGAGVICDECSFPMQDLVEKNEPRTHHQTQL